VGALLLEWLAVLDPRGVFESDLGRRLQLTKG